MAEEKSWVRRDGVKEGELVSFEVVPPTETGISMFDPGTVVTPENVGQFRPSPGVSERAARELRRLGFRVLHVGCFSISGEAPREVWERTFRTRVQEGTAAFSDTHPELRKRRFLTHLAGVPFEIPDTLKGLVERAYPQRLPTFFESPIPPTLAYHYLDVPGDISLILRADRVHREGTTGRGVLVAMPDTGFYKHPFYRWRGYSYTATIAPDASDVEMDEYGHGTAEAANIFACAPNVEFVGVKMGFNPTLAFKMAVELHPAIVTNSWGFSIPGDTLPNYLKPLEAEIVRTVKELGIAVVFSAGNGHHGWPAQMPEVIAVGGVYAHRSTAADEFELEASDYASSFVSQVYPARAVPDVCGLVGMKPRAIYIMLPVQPECEIDTALAGVPYPDKDETAADDGWAVISGTSAAAPQTAGVCALLKEAQPSLSPSLLKSILNASARDVTKGKSAMGDKAGKGLDSATGAGLLDAFSAYRLARSVSVRPLQTLPPPR